jgi:hypothetical protein
MTSNEDEERRLIAMYTTQYNQINMQIVQADRRIERMHNSLDEIRNNINRIVLRSETNNLRQASAEDSNNLRQDSNNLRPPVASNFRRSPNNNYNREYVHYDYTNPINPNTYLEPQIPTPVHRTNDSTLTNLLSAFLETTVSVRPTVEQINAATTLIRYSDIVEPISTTCVISMETFLPSDMVRQINHCKHLFLPDQFSRWFQNNVKCPVCRHDIRTSNTELRETNAGLGLGETQGNTSNLSSMLTDFLVETMMEPYTRQRQRQNNNDGEILLFEAIITPNDI